MAVANAVVQVRLGSVEPLYASEWPCAEPGHSGHLEFRPYPAADRREAAQGPPGGCLQQAPVRHGRGSGRCVSPSESVQLRPGVIMILRLLAY
jgi:hypothetical protein